MTIPVSCQQTVSQTVQFPDTKSLVKSALYSWGEPWSSLLAHVSHTTQF